MNEQRHQLAKSLAGHYTIERELGRGGMATVYLAHDVRHDRPVALKVLHPDLASALGPERFQREIRLAARLQHPHILTVHDSGDASGQLWFTMPYVAGESLRDRLTREKQLPIEDALRIAREAAQALEYAHRHGVIHRDIKPENLLLTEDGNTLVADFGIARSLAPGGQQLTETGMSLGTAAYMSPEQAAGERELDARSDVYSLAIVLYEMLAGETPFAAATPQATIARRFTDTPKPLRQVRESVPESVELTVQKALARTAADRFASARAFADSLGPAVTMGVAIPSVVSNAVGVPDRASAAPSMKGGSTPPRHRSLRALATLALGFVLGLGLLFAWRRNHTADATPGSRRLAVLPFENLGDSADAYFADGVTDAVRGKLTAISALEVIARSSSEQYRGSTKPPQQIAQELGVRYLLTGTVRWAKQPDGPSRVQVRPELVDLGGGTARSRWQQPFDAPLTDVFEVQGDIAGEVASALDVALGASDRQQLAERPTQDLAAYDAFLKGEAILGTDDASLRRAIAFYEQAVARDSSFGIAWARLAAQRTSLYGNSLVKMPIEPANEALERAQALAPHAVESYRARAFYEVLVRRDNPAALAVAQEGLARYPANSELMRTVGGIELALGRVDAGLATMRRALALDPRSVRAMRSLIGQLLPMHRWVEARALVQQVLALQPGDLETINSNVISYLGEGDLAGARRVLAEAPPSVDRAALLAYNTMYQDLYWVLDEAQQDTVLALPLSSFYGDRGSQALAFAQIYHQRGDAVRTRIWADTARIAFEEQAGAAPENQQLPALLGLALAYGGRYPDAARFAERAVALSAGESQIAVLQYSEHLLARIYILAGENDKALDLIDSLLKEPYYISPGWLRIDPAFAPLRGNARFEKLIAGS